MSFIFFQINGLKILFYTYAFPEFVQPFILNQVIGLLDYGHDVTILSPSVSYGVQFTSLSDIPKEDNVYIEKYNLLEKTYKELPAQKKKFDIIFCQQGTLGERFFKEIKKHKIKGKVITFLRGKDITARLREKPERYQNLYKQGVFFLPVCDYFRKILIKNKCSSKKIYVLYAGIDCNKFKFKERSLKKDEPIKIMTTGRLVEKKGIKYAIKAVYSLLGKGKKLEFTIIGGGPLEKELKDLVRDLGVEENIKLIGWRSQQEVVELLDQAHLFILPAVTGDDGDQEGISNALKEAMAMGLPVISTYHSGIPELIENGKNGFLVKERSIKELVSILEYLINNQEIWKNIGKEARKKIEADFDMEKQNSKLAKICEYISKKQMSKLRKEFDIK